MQGTREIYNALGRVHGTHVQFLVHFSCKNIIIKTTKLTTTTESWETVVVCGTKTNARKWLHTSFPYFVSFAKTVIRSTWNAINAMQKVKRRSGHIVIVVTFSSNICNNVVLDGY